MKPSERIGSTPCGSAHDLDVKREIDVLHDRIEVLEKAQEYAARANGVYVEPKEMKPKTIDDLFIENGFFCHDKSSINAKEKMKTQLIELFMSCVPEERLPPDKRSTIDELMCTGWNYCRDQIIKNLEKLK